MGRRTETDRMASIKRIAVAAAVVLLLSMAVVGAASAYTVTYDGNGATSGMVPADQTGTSITISGNTGSLIKNGNMFFAGWNTVKNPTQENPGDAYAPGTVVNTDLTLYAQWTDEYTSVEYITSNGSSYIDTGYIAQGKKTEYYTNFDVTNSNAGIFGAGGPGDYNWTGIPYIVGSSDTNRLALGSSYNQNQKTIKRGSFNEYYLRVDDVNKQWCVTQNGSTSSNSYGGVIYNNTIYLFGWHQGGGLAAVMVGSLSRFIIVSDDVLVRDYIPCIKKEGSIKGMYDVVNGEFYTSKGSSFSGAGSTAYAVTYMGNGNTSGTAPVDCTMYKENAVVTVKDQGTMVKKDRNFYGWSANVAVTKSDGSHTYAVGDLIPAGTVIKMPGSSVVFTAVWGWKVTYDTNGGGGTAPVDSTWYATGATVEVMDKTSDMTKTDYYFAGWTLNSGGTGTVYGPGQTFVITADTILYANWVTKGSPHYTVAYNANGATSGAAPFDENNPYVSDAEVTVLGNTGSPALSKTGYYFAGWYCTRDLEKYDGTGTISANTIITAGTEIKMPEYNIVLYAKWTPKTYTITYMDKGGGAYSGNNESSLPATHIYDTKTTLVDGTKTGYTFGGWFKESDCSGTAVTELGATEYTDNITLYAKWTPITYTVRYNANGGSGSMVDQVFTYDVAQNLRTNEFIKDGCTFFSGWATEEHGSVVYSDEQSVSNLTSTDNATVDLYAVWDTITYTFVIPAALTLDGSGTATTADYSITMTSTQVSGDSRKINMNLTGSVNYDTENDAFRVKNLYSENYQEYTVKKSDNTLVKRGDTIVSVRVDGTDGTTKTEKLSYRLTGSTAYAGTYQDTLTFEVSVKSLLPAGYTEVEYIESTGTQYIDTGVHFKYGDEFYFKWMKTAILSGENVGYGAMNPNNQNSVCITGAGRTNYNRMTIFINGSTYNLNPSVSISDTVNHVMDEHWYIDTGSNRRLYASTYDFSNNKTYTLTGPNFTSNWECDNNVYLFRDNSTIWPQYSAQKVYPCWLKRSTGEYAFYLIPCIRNSDSKPGMYDLVSGTFLVNQGSGEFTYGSGITYNDVTNVSISGGTSVTKGSTLQLTANVTPVDATNQVVSWKSSDTSVATVDFFTGKVTGVAAGTATITATVNDYPVKTATCEVTVNVAS